MQPAPSLLPLLKEHNNDKIHAYDDKRYAWNYVILISISSSQTQTLLPLPTENDIM